VVRGGPEIACRFASEVEQKLFNPVLLETGVDIKPIITHRYSYEDFEKGFEAIRSGNCGKVILDFESI